MTTNNKIKESEIRYHNKVFKEGSKARDKTLRYYSITSVSTEYYLNRLKDKIGENKNVLEYGCGAGGDFELYKSSKSNLYGIDISKEAISLARKKCANLNLKSNYVVADAENTKLKGDYFDAIVGSGIIHHLNIENAMSELSRLIKSDGECIFHEPMGHNPFINLFRSLTPHMRTPDEHPILTSDFVLMKKYFEKVEVRYFYLLSLSAFIFRNTIFFDRIYKLLIKLDKHILKNIPWLGKYSWITVIILSKPKKI